MTSDNQTDKKFVRKGNIDKLVTVPILFAMLLLIGWAYFGEKILLGEVPQKYNYIVLGISAFIFGLRVYPKKAISWTMEAAANSTKAK